MKTKSKKNILYLMLLPLTSLALPAHSYPADVLHKWTESAGKTACYVLGRHNLDMFSSGLSPFDAALMLFDNQLVSALKGAPNDILDNAVYYLNQFNTQQAAAASSTNEMSYLILKDLLNRCPDYMLPKDRATLQSELPALRQKSCHRNC